jgi:Double zinc ribbon
VSIQFTRNYRDLSTDKGYQFEFYCDRCGSGHRTTFKATAGGVVSDLLGAAGSMFGGVFGRAQDLTDRARSATWERAHDKAFQEAMGELQPQFHHCPRCTSWVDQQCWIDARGLCKSCAPDVAEEAAHAQVAAEIQRTNEAVYNAATAREELVERTVTVQCRHCGAQTGGAKFCPECGTQTTRERFCGECGAKMPDTVKFCPECGAKAQP